MYRYHVPKRAPLAFWQLDDPVPFQEHSGLGAVATKKAGTADPTKSVPLVAGAQFSSVFDKASVGEFDCPIFKQGLERRPFALESWILPVPKTSGFEAQEYRENLHVNPSGENASTIGYSFWPGVGGASSIARLASSSSITGGYVTRMTWSTPPSPLSGGIKVMSAGTQYFSLEPEQTYTFSCWVRTSQAQKIYPAAEAWSAASGVSQVAGASITGAVVNTNANTWTKVNFTITTHSLAGTGVFYAFTLYHNNGGTAMVANDWCDVDGVLVEKSATAGTYFDGSMPGYEWVGTAHNSVSRTISGVSKVNYALNPDFTVNISSFGNIGSGGTTWSRVATGGYDGGPFLRQTVTTNGQGAGGGMMTSVVPIGTYYYSFWARSSVGMGPSKFYLEGSAASGAVVTERNDVVSVPSNTWFNFRGKIVTTRVGDLKPGLNYGNATVAGELVDYDGWVVSTDPSHEFFDGNSPGAEWAGTANNSPSYMLSSNDDQQILSNLNAYDGLSINGKVVRFGTSYLSTGDAFCDYDLGEFQMAHVVGIHNEDQNQLWVNGKMVASVDITDEQKADSYIVTDSHLYSGMTVSSSETAMNAVAFYASLSGDQIVQNYAAGINTLGQARVTPQLGGLTMSLDAADGSVFLRESWATKSEFELGVKNNVEIGPEEVTPSYSGGVSLAGSWLNAVPLDVQGDNSIYGVMLSWSGNDITVEVSLDGTTWSPATSGELVSIIPNAYNPTNKDLQIRVNFAGGLEDDPAYLESLTVIGFRNNTVNSLANRAVTVTHPAVVRGDYEPTLYRDDNGIHLNGGTLTIGTDTSTDPEVARTLELWIKPLYGPPSISVTGTKYRNGFADSTMPIGEWSLVHIVAAADIASAITVTGDCIVGQATTYPTALTAAEVEFVFDSYVGAAVSRFTDTATIGISEGATPAAVYAHDWGIDSAG